MIAALLLPLGLAAITTAPASPAPASPTPAGTPAPVEIRDIAPPVDVFPYPPWMVAVAAVVAAVLIGLAVWWFVSWLRKRPGPPPLSATAIALRDLEELRRRVNDLEPYAFSFRVSDVLRTFISHAKFQLPATHQTSPEFLTAISGSELFSDNDRELLGHFLEKCDMIKFARAQATAADNAELVESALAFVQGGRG